MTSAESWLFVRFSLLTKPEISGGNGRNGTRTIVKSDIRYYTQNCQISKGCTVYDIYLELEATSSLWLFQLDDSKSLHGKWVFHQTSIYKWLFRVPGIYLPSINLHRSCYGIHSSILFKLGEATPSRQIWSLHECILVSVN